MPVYLPGKEVINASQNISGTEFDGDISVAEIVNFTLSGYVEKSIDLIIYSELRHSAYIMGAEIEVGKSLGVTIKLKS